MIAPVVHLYRSLLAWDVADPGSIAVLQRELGVSADGVYGRRTRAAHLARLDEGWAAVCAARDGWQYTGSAVPLTRERPRAPRISDTIRGVVLHWPVRPTTARGLDRRWARRVREGDGVVCSHCSLDEDHVVWSAGPHRVTAHAGAANARSIGVDVCVPVLLDDEDEARARGVYAGQADGLLLLAPHVAARVTELRRALAAVVPDLAWSDHAAVEPERKKDCRIWREELTRAGCPLETQEAWW